jgi:hypothetical protein
LRGLVPWRRAEVEKSLARLQIEQRYYGLGADVLKPEGRRIAGVESVAAGYFCGFGSGWRFVTYANPNVAFGPFHGGPGDSEGGFFAVLGDPAVENPARC